MPVPRNFVLIAAAVAGTVAGALSATGNANPSANPTVDPAHQSLGRAFGALVANAIPAVYDKQDDWGNQKQIVVGLRTEGKGFRTKIKRRKKSVNHGVWKHYRVRLIDPDKHFHVAVENLRALEAGRAGFTLRVQAKLDGWARAKVYQYGVHLIALEVVGDMQVDLALDCEVGVQVQVVDGAPGVALEPTVADARLQLAEFRLRRVSNAKGPLVRELGDGLKRAIERELHGPKLVAKLNRAIEKKRDRLQLGVGDLLNSDWGPLARVAPVAGQEHR